MTHDFNSAKPFAFNSQLIRKPKVQDFTADILNQQRFSVKFASLNVHRVRILRTE